MEVLQKQIDYDQSEQAKSELKRNLEIYKGIFEDEIGKKPD